MDSSKSHGNTVTCILLVVATVPAEEEEDILKASDSVDIDIKKSILQQLLCNILVSIVCCTGQLATGDP